MDDVMSRSSFARPCGSGADSPITSLAEASSGNEPEFSETGVGPCLQDETPALLEQLGQRMESAYMLFKKTGLAADRAEARRLLSLVDQAIAARSDSQRAMDEGCDYFQVEGARMRRILIARGLAGGCDA